MSCYSLISCYANLIYIYIYICLISIFWNVINFSHHTVAVLTPSNIYPNSKENVSICVCLLLFGGLLRHYAHFSRICLWKMLLILIFLQTVILLVHCFVIQPANFQHDKGGAILNVSDTKIVPATQFNDR